MSMPHIRLISKDERNSIHNIPVDEWKALLTVGRYNGWAVTAGSFLPGEPLRRRNATFRVPWSGGRTMGDGDELSPAEAESLAKSIEEAAEMLVNYLRHTKSGVTIEAVDLAIQP